VNHWGKGNVKKTIFSVLGLLALTVILTAADLPHRRPAVSGMWYPSNKVELKQHVDLLLSSAEKKIQKREGEPPAALIVPHAGYVYSGATAAAGYAHLVGKKWKRAVILGPAHRAYFRGASIADVSAYDTPLGSVFLDRKACDNLLKSTLMMSHPSAHVQEHNIECQLPFLQVIQPDIRIVPILVGEMTADDMSDMAHLIESLLDHQTILVVSSDFTHFGPNFRFVPFKTDVKQNLKKWAMSAGHRIVALDFDGFMAHLRDTRDTICGRNAIGIAIKTLQRLAKRKKIKGYIEDFTTSGEITNDWTNSVSYLSILFTDPPGVADASEKKSTKEISHKADFHLTPVERNTLLRLARQTLEYYLSKNVMPEFDPDECILTPTLETPCGAFVTLTKKKRLRGCIGYVVAVKPLYQAVMEMAVNAAVRDRRFIPVTKNELKDIDIEISVLSPLSPCDDLKKIQIGKHGLIIQKDGRSGLLLPQVPVELGWDRKEFLKQVCRKAGLKSSAYHEPGAVLFTFTAEVFHEEE